MNMDFIKEKDLTGTFIGEYQVERKLGEGGMGTVWLANHPMLGQKVAFKILNPVFSQNREVRERFIQEARIQVHLKHPNIVRVLTAITKVAQPMLVMEYVDGVSLGEVLERRGKLPTDEALRIIKQVVDGLAYAHGRGVVHRDMKPSNIMVQADGTATIMDFGIAKVLGNVRLTMTGTAMGSAPYMSPEQVLGKKEIDHRTDIYSLGVTLYETLTGKLPFGGDDDSTQSDFLIKQAHLNQEPPRLPHINSPADELLNGVITLALQKDPDDRIKSCEQFLEFLEQIEPARTPPVPQLKAPEKSPVVAQVQGGPARGTSRIVQCGFCGKQNQITGDPGNFHCFNCQNPLSHTLPEVVPVTEQVARCRACGRKSLIAGDPASYHCYHCQASLSGSYLEEAGWSAEEYAVTDTGKSGGCLIAIVIGILVLIVLFAAANC